MVKLGTLTLRTLSKCVSNSIAQANHLFNGCATDVVIRPLNDQERVVRAALDHFAKLLMYTVSGLGLMHVVRNSISKAKIEKQRKQEIEEAFYLKQLEQENKELKRELELRKFLWQLSQGRSTTDYLNELHQTLASSKFLEAWSYTGLKRPYAL